MWIRYLAQRWHHFGVSKALVVAHVGEEEGSIHQKCLKVKQYTHTHIRIIYYNATQWDSHKYI